MSYRDVSQLETRYIAIDAVAMCNHGRVAGYSGTPLARKLGVRPGTTLLLDGAPAGFEIDELPEDVDVRRRAGSGPYDVILTFCTTLKRLSARWAVLHPLTTTAGALWVAWPKRTSPKTTSPKTTSGVSTDLNENIIREFALGHGRVDVKVCAVDDVWSALKNVIRKADR
jgi:hypothetical protein